ncbi:MAG: substrate-binding domain-containing protein [Cyanobacteria bacterium P01_C01_bin.72]
MFKKSDVLPLTLAFISTVLIVILGFNWLAKSNIAGFDQGSERPQKNAQTSTPNTQANPASKSSVANNPQAKFIVPAIVPQGTSVSINGSSKFSQINRALRKSFHQQYPGTVITTDADGVDVGLDLLYAGDIDIVALARPLSEAEKKAGLTAIPIGNSEDIDHAQSQMYYVYREPISPDIEAFLGYALSAKGRKAIGNF